ncbi:MAG: purine-nucleoside phosphorylase [Clostridiales bacterium]|nr:purine-nucleoside phosphorylase [Clostridiales bacterium]
MDQLTKIKQSYEFIKRQTKYSPTLGLILGSGLGAIAEEIEDPEFYKYEDIPNFPTSTIEGHKGRLVIGNIQGKTVIAMEGRFHFYEGYNMNEVTFPIRVMKLLGITTIIVTNAAGAVNTSFNPGDLMLITDHINLSGSNPLIGRNLDDFGSRFPDMSEAYNKELISHTKSLANELNIEVKEGVYTMLSGPSYETPAEIKMVRILGGDAVGMSTVPEVIVANHCKINVLGISCLTNMAAGILNEPLSHNEVIETSNRVKNNFISLVKKIIKEI